MQYKNIKIILIKKRAALKIIGKILLAIAA